MVPPNGDCPRARSRSTWIHWWSPVASAPFARAPDRDLPARRNRHHSGDGEAALSRPAGRDAPGRGAFGARDDHPLGRTGGGDMRRASVGRCALHARGRIGHRLRCLAGCIGVVSGVDHAAGARWVHIDHLDDAPEGIGTRTSSAGRSASCRPGSRSACNSPPRTCPSVRPRQLPDGIRTLGGMSLDTACLDFPLFLPADRWVDDAPQLK